MLAGFVANDLAPASGLTFGGAMLGTIAWNLLAYLCCRRAFRRREGADVCAFQALLRVRGYGAAMPTMAQRCSAQDRVRKPLGRGISIADRARIERP